MAKAHQYYMPDGYYAGTVEDLGLLPANATYKAPDIIEGHIPRWNGTAWKQVETHKGKEGYLDGKPHTIKSHGPLPAGWSDIPPPPTPEELAERRKMEIQARLNEFDLACIRPLRAISDGTATDYDREKLSAIETEIAILREELTAR